MAARPRSPPVILRRAGALAADGREPLGYLAAHSAPDLILPDVLMSALDG
jgi:CheY-like chemotaxis protein